MAARPPPSMMAPPQQYSQGALPPQGRPPPPPQQQMQQKMPPHIQQQQQQQRRMMMAMAQQRQQQQSAGIVPSGANLQNAMTAGLSINPATAAAAGADGMNFNITSQQQTRTTAAATASASLNPIKKSSVMVDWESVFTALFRKVSPERITEVRDALKQFEGMYEAAFTALCRFYGVAVPIEFVPIPIDPTSQWAKLRVARLLIRRVGANLFHLNLLEDALRDLATPKNGNVLMEFERIEAKYGPEPLPSEPFSLLERLTLACAMNGKMEVRHRFVAQMSVQTEHPEIAFASAIEELPEGEIVWEDVADPRDIRTRFRAMLNEYDKPLLSKMDAILENAEDPIALFTQMQRSYGREPRSGMDDQSKLQQDGEAAEGGESTESGAGGNASFDGTQKGGPNAPNGNNANAKDEAEESEEKAAANQVLHLESLRNDVFIMPKSKEYARDLELDKTFDKIAKYILESTHVDKKTLTKFTTRIFEVLDRSMLNVVNDLIAPRVDPKLKFDYETQEWLQFIHCFYVNGVPPQANNVSLRTVVSLLYMKLGGAIWEVKAAGGVDAFMEKAGTQDAQEQQDRAFNLRVMYGSIPDEADLAVRNRKRIYFAAYNPTFPIEKIDAAVEKILSTNREGKRWEDIFKNMFGPPPKPLRVSEKRVRDILHRFAHTKEEEWKTIADAHTDIGDTAEDVIANLVRTYGPERSSFDDKLEKNVLSAECEFRFRIFAAEMRTRDVILRRATAALSSSDPKKFGTRAVDQRLQIQKMLVAKSAEEERKRQEKNKNDLQSLQLSQIDSMMAEEDLDRKDIEVEERALRETLMSQILAIAPQAGSIDTDDDVKIDITETITRHVMLDEARATLRKLKEQMINEASNLKTFLADRILWRKKWERDEEIRIAILQMKDLEAKWAEEERIAKEAERQKIIISSSRQTTQGAEHNNKRMIELYQQINDQTRRNLSFSVEVENHRAQYRSEVQSKVKPALDKHGLSIHIDPRRPLHKGCCFSGKGGHSYDAQNNSQQSDALVNYAVPITEQREKDALNRRYADTTNPDDMTEDELNFMFLDQLREYLQNLFRKYDPKLEGTERQLLSQFAGNESKLIAALEQQYNVDHWMETHLHHRLTEYYRRMAPESMDEIPSMVQRFIGNEEAMWAFLKNRHGPVPALQSSEMQKYIHSRLLRYFTQRAPHLLPDIDRYIIMIGESNGDAVFRELAIVYGPEDRPIQLDTLIRKLRRFYRERGIRRQFDDIPILARRFVGHEGLLNRILQAKFDDNLQMKQPDVSDFRNK